MRERGVREPESDERERGLKIVDAEIRGLFTKLVYNTHHVVGIPSTVGLL